MLTFVDTFLTARTTALFTGGFLVDGARRTLADFAGFALQSLVLDATFVLGLWLIALPLLRRVRIHDLQKLATAGLVALFPPFVFLYLRYGLARYVGRMLDPSLWLAISGGSRVEWFAQGAAQIVPALGVVLVVLVTSVFAVRLLRGVSRTERAQFEIPSFVTLAAAFLLGSGLSVGVLANVCAHGGTACEALESKASGALLLPFFERATDFDFDGYGAFPPLADTAPFDASRHPYALDIPGDGIDQNGLGGDHPRDYRPPADAFVDRPRFRTRPNLLLIFLEGVRADIVSAKLGGKPIMPFVDGLAARGARSEHAYANSPYTARSRGQLMGGRLSPFPNQSTLVDDFHANGYEVAWISGQDESFGAEESEMLGIRRTDLYFDARQDVGHSVARFSTSGSEMVSWKRVNERVKAMLDWHTADHPLFLFVNYGDTHFPYDHSEMDDVLGVPRLGPREIRPENAAGVYATYANAAANVDRAIEQLVAMWRAKLGPDGAIVITSDHGEALFESGVLGHGLALDATQTRVPLITVGLSGVWPEPLGLSDLRGAIQRSLTEEATEPLRFEPVPGRHLLQYMAVVEHPRLLCLRSFDRELRYDTTDPPPPDSEDFRQLIWWWESLQLERSVASAQ
ncbi:MAG TPA: sulfatase-like hydrolase/transferase [Myxococcota bacterium]|nr:sulfatase-like hydrolase/transferase [Myxococcota bacterium]